MDLCCLAGIAINASSEANLDSKAAFELVNTIDDIYSRILMVVLAFAGLFLSIIALFAIAVPSWIAWCQKRLVRIETQKMEDRYSILEKRIEEEVASLQSRIEKDSMNLQGGILLQQAQANLGINDPIAAFDFQNAAGCFYRAERYDSFVGCVQMARSVVDSPAPPPPRGRFPDLRQTLRRHIDIFESSPIIDGRSIERELDIMRSMLRLIE